MAAIITVALTAVARRAGETKSLNNAAAAAVAAAVAVGQGVQRLSKFKILYHSTSEDSSIRVISRRARESKVVMVQLVPQRY